MSKVLYLFRGLPGGGVTTTTCKHYNAFNGSPVKNIISLENYHTTPKSRKETVEQYQQRVKTYRLTKLKILIYSNALHGVDHLFISYGTMGSFDSVVAKDIRALRMFLGYESRVYIASTPNLGARLDYVLNNKEETLLSGEFNKVATLLKQSTKSQHSLADIKRLINSFRLDINF
jgi:hypothetical protein